jgi:hypothetical protein
VLAIIVVGMNAVGAPTRTTLILTLVARVVAAVILVLILVIARICRFGSTNVTAGGRRKVTTNFLDGQFAVLAGSRNELTMSVYRLGGIRFARVEIAGLTLLPRVATGIFPIVRFVVCHGQDLGG